MSGSTFGKQFTITTWGESHGKGIGCVVDGCPAGLSLQEADIQTYLNRRKPGQNKFNTPRKESDVVEILSGIFEGKTTGAPISLLVHNQNQHTKDYDHLLHVYRPGHADFTFEQKYGIRDHRGGGRSSGRETVGRVAGGAVAATLLKQLNITLNAFSKSIGEIIIPTKAYDFAEINQNPFYMPNATYAKETAAYLEHIMKQQDSCGGIVECIVTGLPLGLGEPVFDKLDANIAKALMSIGAVKGVEIGDGMDVTKRRGSENNDAFYVSDRHIYKQSNHAGGVLGGLSDGAPLVVRAAIKPTPSIGQTQRTATKDFSACDIRIHGRHDPIIVPRAVVVIESMIATTLADLLLQNMSSRMDYLTAIYK
ncbi:MAG: chorismate synthase [Lachnospiraceae bacterium]|nr:chorismate synthase [Lachnospiraceae bacterium]